MIHVYWHTTPPEWLVENVASWAAIGETVSVWSPTDFPDLFKWIESTNAGVNEVDQARHAANVVRWHLLYTHGGVWADADVTALRPLPTLPAGPWSIGFGSTATPFLCGGPAGHGLWERTLAAALDHPRGTSPVASGGRLLGRITRAGELTIIPPGRFTATDAAGDPLPEPAGGRYTEHEWVTSKQRWAQRRGRRP